MTCITCICAFTRWVLWAACGHTHLIAAPATDNMPQVAENGGLPSLAEALKGRTSIKSIVEAKDEGLSNVGSSLLVAGWVRTGRQQGSGAHEPWAFLELNDGSTHANLQVHRLHDACMVHAPTVLDKVFCRLLQGQRGSLRDCACLCRQA